LFLCIISVRVAFIFDPQSLLIGILKAAKMRARVNSVNSLQYGSNFGVDRLVLGGTLGLIFQSRFFFMRRKINFSFFLVDFDGGF